MSWWRSHSVRVSLTMWNVAAMMVVLAVYAVGVFMFVSRDASNALNPQTGQTRTRKHVVIQVVRSESMMHQELARLLVILLLGVPIGVAAAGTLGYSLARRALAPVERMAERAQSITAANLHDRLPVHN